MRLALVIAPSDPRSGDAGSRREALAWLRGRLARFGFHVVIVGGGQDPVADIARATERVSVGDTVLVHASGRLAGREAIAFGDAGLVPLGSLTDALAARAPFHVSFVLELTHDEHQADALVGAQILNAAVRALRAKTRGYPVLAAVRPLGTEIDRIAFTRLALPAVNEHSGPPPTEALVASMYEAASASEESHAVAQSFTFSRGDGSIPPPPASSGAFERAKAVYAHAPAPLIAEIPSEPALEVVAAGPPVSGTLAAAPGVETFAQAAPPPAVAPPFAAAPPAETFAAAAPANVPAERSIHSLIAEATEGRDWVRALELRRYRLPLLPSPRQQSRELVAIARILQVEFNDADGAIDALEMARGLDPKPVTVLQALRRGYEKLGRWNHAVEVTAALAALAESAIDRATLYTRCAVVALERLSDRDGAVAWFEAALADDPTNRRALDALAHLRPPQSPFGAASTEHVRPPQTPFGSASTEHARTPQAPFVAPLQPLAAPSSPALPDASARERTVARLFAEGYDDLALAELEALAAEEPTRISIYEMAFAAHRRAGRTDAALFAAFALEELEAADVDEQVLIDQFRSVGPTRIRSSIDDAAWDELRGPGADDVLLALFAAIESAAIAAKLEELREQRRLIALDPADRLGETSTATIARSFQWAARVLAVPCPNLYVRDDVRGGIAAIPAPEPSTGLGTSVISGLSAKDLAFLAGRYLTYYRPGHQVLVHYPDREQLTTLLLAAAQIAMPKAFAATADGAVRALRTRLARHLQPNQRAALDEAVRALDARGGQASLGAWICSVELTAGRAGLLLCGDLATATAQVRAADPAIAPAPLETRRGDLVAFCASRAHAAMRLRFAMTAPESVHPPPPSNAVARTPSAPDATAI